MYLNLTRASTFQLLGFSGLQNYKIPLFLSFLLVYLLTLTGNLMLICVACVDTRLHKPMYYFLTHLSVLEVSYTSVVIPKMMENFLVHHQTISAKGCFAQMYFFCVFGATESLLLAIMAYDRYLAICKPLHYPRLMHPKSCHHLSIGSWLAGFLAALIPVMSIANLSFCSSHEVAHFFCDLLPILKLSCSDTRLIELSIFILTSVMAFGSFSWTLVSYVFVVAAILRLPSTTSRERAFSTCASHLMVVSIFYGTVIS
ncbi:hypothetical protein FKM82_026884, partial [Ascaphus truei]